ncbi:hypothetical protein [Salininema proteolyticum]|uniref:Uncharacterized protein n=1 Tax=Salininema proteolyticum TaxID=1607685 RepID=A0ABV8TVC0_9ACTN
MKTLHRSAFDRAERYLALNARLIDRLRFARLFHGGPSRPILEVLHGYQNPDGGFGNAIEPDLRGSASQPVPAWAAFQVLDEIDAFDDPCVADACDWLEATSNPDGGVPWVLPSVRDSERAPWWQPEGDPAPSSIIATGLILGLLHLHGVEHPWVARATAYCWDHLSKTGELGAYDALAVLAFLEGVPDRDRAETELERLSDSLLATVAFDPETPGHVHSPLDFAPNPDALARGLFADSDIDRQLDHLIATQNDDGGWAPNFAMWTPVVAHEWGGHLTLARLATLRAYGRIA